MIDVNAFTNDVKTQILGWLFVHWHQPGLPHNHRRRYYILYFPVAAAVQSTQRWYV